MRLELHEMYKQFSDWRQENASKFLEQMIAHAQGVCHRGKRWVHCADAWKKAGVDDVQVFEFVCPAIPVKHGCRGIVAKATSPHLVGDATQVNLILHIQISRDQVVVHVELIEKRLQLLIQ